MELVRWLGEVELTFNPSFYPSLVRMPMARRLGLVQAIGNPRYFRRAFPSIQRDRCIAPKARLPGPGVLAQN